jgi:DNA-binding LacI/PurR family transcriptional regulator
MDFPEVSRELKFRQLAAELRAELRAGRWAAGAKLPTEQVLAAGHRVSVTTVRRAVDELVAEGLVVRRQGAGTFAAETPDRGRERPVIGVMVPDTAFYYPKVLRGVEEALSAAGARMMLTCSSYDPHREAADIQGFVESGVHGMLLVPTLDALPDPGAVLRDIDRLPVPVVLMERRPAGFGTPGEYVCTHHEAGAYEAVRHLVDLGHRRIGLVLREFSPTTGPVARGFEQAVLDFDVTSVRFGAAPGDWGQETARQSLAQLRTAGMTAALCFGDREATLLVAAARRSGLSVPGDLAVVAYDDEIADLADVPLTAVAPPKQLLGRTAAELLLRRLGEPDMARHQIMLRPGLSVRDSCGARTLVGEEV